MLNFDSFPSKYEAEMFAESVRKKFKLSTYICDTQKEADAIDLCPYHLYPPIVLVEKAHDVDDLVKVVAKFKGQLADA